MNPELLHTLKELLPHIQGYIYPNEIELQWSLLVVRAPLDAVALDGLTHPAEAELLRDASSAAMPQLHVSFGEYIQLHLGLTKEQSDALRRRYWLRYGATLLGLVRHHGVDAAHFLHETHVLPGLEAERGVHVPEAESLAVEEGVPDVIEADEIEGAAGVKNIFPVDDERLFAAQDGPVLVAGADRVDLVAADLLT